MNQDALKQALIIDTIFKLIFKHDDSLKGYKARNLVDTDLLQGETPH